MAPASAPVSDDGQMKELSAKQGQYLAFIYYYEKVNGRPPAETTWSAISGCRLLRSTTWCSGWRPRALSKGLPERDGRFGSASHRRSCRIWNSRPVRRSSGRHYLLDDGGALCQGRRDPTRATIPATTGGRLSPSRIDRRLEIVLLFNSARSSHVAASASAVAFNKSSRPSSFLANCAMLNAR
jgi:hypothetical protein